MNLVTRKHLSRRAVLRGLGATVALPMLDAMTPAFAAPAAGRPVRLAFAYVPNGVIMADWTPKGTGAEFELSRLLKPLEPFREDLLVLSGLAHHNANALGRGLERSDRRVVRQIAQRLADRQYRFSALVEEIAKSLPFQMRRKDHTKA